MLDMLFQVVILILCDEHALTVGTKVLRLAIDPKMWMEPEGKAVRMCSTRDQSGPQPWPEMLGSPIQPPLCCHRVNLDNPSSTVQRSSLSQCTKYHLKNRWIALQSKICCAISQEHAPTTATTKRFRLPMRCAISCQAASCLIKRYSITMTSAIRAIERIPVHGSLRSSVYRAYEDTRGRTA